MKKFLLNDLFNINIDDLSNWKVKFKFYNGYTEPANNAK